MKVWAVVAPILVSVLLTILITAVRDIKHDYGAAIAELQAERVLAERWRGEITTKTDANGAKVENALADMATTRQLLNDIRVEIARKRP